NYTHHSSGHRYFSLKDDNAVLKIVMWRSLASGLKFEPEPGQKVLAYGDITVYPKGGVYQLNCKKLVPVGIGPLELAFRQLHEKLSAEGLFEPDRKQSVPEYARKIGVVTSPTGAAIRDFIQIARRRNPTVQLIIYPAQVQGEGAETTVRAGIEYFNSRDDVDLIVITRGGGSLEDLWAFNTEIAVRAVAASKLPIVSAIGHEVDTSLCDLAADLRAPTPSAAAELTVWSRKEFAESIAYHTERQRYLLTDRVRTARQTLDWLRNRPVFARPLTMIAQYQKQMAALLALLHVRGKSVLRDNRHRLDLALSKLDAVSPLAAFRRGYSMTRRLPKKTLLKSVGDVYPTDRIETSLGDGSIISYVEEIKPKAKKSRHAGKKEV
ncbi:exodeoxyribonuclease VII large subunit, partial [candidate division GN15 bacterium]|nr:exodeoxyribonuclease VII large subunit [candidate division GN15 bacterium]